VTETVLANGILEGRGAVDIAVRDGTIVAIDPTGPASEEAIDLGGRLVCPALIDGHIHLDKTLLGMPWQSHRPGETVAARIEAEKRQLAETSVPTIERASTLVRKVIGFGTTRLRCHVDVDPGCKLSNLHAVLAVREAFRDAIDIQIVAFPQSGIRAAPGTADLLDAAMREGAEVVGGLDPAGIDDDVEGHLTAVFAVAERHGAGIDIHLHDPGPLGAFELRRIAERSRAAGMQGKVAVSHAFALGELDAATFARTADALAEGGVAIMTNGPGAATIPPILALARRGVLVFAGSDNIRDSWSPYGNGDMLERVGLIGYRARLSTDDELRFAFALATEHAARATGIAPRGITVGEPADIVALRAAHVPEAVATRAGERMVFKRGVRVA
jgi:cytosine/adenosine deaminase-related metal-dependent hydrolase